MKPTLANVLPRYEPSVRLPSLWAKEQGAIVAIPGPGTCPWCDLPIIERSSRLGGCPADASHVVQLLPWGS